MAEVTKLFVLFLAIFVCGPYAPCSALRIEISPNRINTVIPIAVQISCTPSKSFNAEAKQIMTMNIIGVDGKPIATLTRGSKTPRIANDKSEVKVEGHIDDVVSDSYLRLTLLNPREEDAGLYQCSIYYLDNSFLLKEKKSQANLTSYDKLDLKSVADYCQGRMSEFEQKLKANTDRNAVLMNKISNLENITSEKDYISAFSAKYTSKGSEAEGQTIVFNEIIMKKGDGYDENTGLFTAPKAGIYGFHVVVLMHSTNSFFDLTLEVNGKTMAGLVVGSDSNYYDQSSISVALNLQTGDVAKIKVTDKSSGAKLQLGEYCVFTGYLLQET